MRRDLCYYYERPFDMVFNAFVQAANQKFGKNCRVTPGKNINFGLNFSFRYNMNGGSVTVHFLPYQTGTAIDIRYTIVQLAGARYKAHAGELINYTDRILQARAIPFKLDINYFLAYEQNGVANQPNMPPMQNGYNNQANMPPMQNGYNNQANMPPVQNGYNNQANMAPVQNGYNNQDNMPPMQNGYNNQANMPPVQNGYNNQANMPPMQNGYNNQANRPLMPGGTSQQPNNQQPVCPQCGKAAPMGARFCAGCGRPLNG